MIMPSSVWELQEDIAEVMEWRSDRWSRCMVGERERERRGWRSVGVLDDGVEYESDNSDVVLEGSGHELRKTMSRRIIIYLLVIGFS